MNVVNHEGDEITDSDNIHGRPQAVAEVNGAGQNHVAAVTAAIDGDPGFIQVRLDSVGTISKLVRARKRPEGNSSPSHPGTLYLADIGCD